jgi:hypothetical protein
MAVLAGKWAGMVITMSPYQIKGPAQLFVIEAVISPDAKMQTDHVGRRAGRPAPGSPGSNNGMPQAYTIAMPDGRPDHAVVCRLLQC